MNSESTHELNSQHNKKIDHSQNKRKTSKKYGLIWEEKLEDIVTLCKEKLPILTEVKTKEIHNNSNSPNILIEADNYHALSVLNYTHKGKIDVIYIDPPYNTGAKDWKFNNNFVDVKDAYRHSKWLSMMYKRLQLAKYLLKKNGVMIITIDDNELLSILGLLQRLESKILGIICIVIKPEGRNQDKHIMSAHEYAIFITWGNPISRKIKLRTKIKQTYNEIASNGKKFRWDTFYRRGDEKENPEEESRWYEIYVNEQTLEISTKKKKGFRSILPIDTKGKKLIWGSLYHDFKKIVENLNPQDPEMIAKRNNSGQITIHIRRWEHINSKPLSYWNNSCYSPQAYGAKLVTNILQNNLKFNYPKSIFATYDCLDIFLPENGIALDFFAGSGTTGHAVLSLNKTDNGNRKFILCTNNENNICTDICYPRLKKVIKGYKNPKGEKIKGLDGNLKYFRTSFVEKANTDKNKKNLVEKVTELLCIKEDCFERLKFTRHYKIFRNNTKYVSILYDDKAINQFKKDIKNSGITTIAYVFSLDEYDKREEFEDIQDKIILKPMPSEIINTYKRIFR